MLSAVTRTTTVPMILWARAARGAASRTFDATMTPNVNKAGERRGTAVLRRLLIGGPSLVHLRDGPRAARVTRNNNA
jgi:hypothetical protein